MISSWQTLTVAFGGSMGVQKNFQQAATPDESSLPESGGHRHAFDMVLISRPASLQNPL